ncbi:MFS transporter [Neobacillus notoginsengisoli]|uniref:MFS transporter n=1 Tax=Neobacillus notoginsengisoli TaxID=1578198 RepID=A0A417Z081_9BACI|nr:MFS transporter [Neobacillus notoginsengisoli]RHW43485.1 MFS transporter [Neobacillus notoginsengisoli]
MLILTNRSFRNLLSGRLLSVFADAMIFYSLLKWIEIQSGSSDSFTLFFIAYYLPVAIFGIPVGSWIEGRTLQKVMILSDALRVAMLCFFPFIMYFAPYQWAYLLLFVLSVLQLFFIPANQSLLPHVVSSEERAKANSLFQIGFTVTKIFGQIITTLLIKLLFPISGLLFISAGLLFLSLFFIRKVQPFFKNKQNAPRGKLQMMKEGLFYIWNQPKFKALFLFLTLAMFIATSVDLVLLSFLTDVLSVGVENLSFIGTASLMGILLGAYLAPKLYPKLDRKWMLIPPLFAVGISVGSLLFITNWQWILPFFFLQGIALGGFNVTIVTYLQDEVDNDYYTRTFSLFNMLTTSVALPGILITGLLLREFETIHTIQLMTGILLLLGVIGCWAIPRLGMGAKLRST